MACVSTTLFLCTLRLELNHPKVPLDYSQSSGMEPLGKALELTGPWLCVEWATLPILSRNSTHNTTLVSPWMALAIGIKSPCLRWDMGIDPPSWCLSRWKVASAWRKWLWPDSVSKNYRYYGRHWNSSPSYSLLRCSLPSPFHITYTKLHRHSDLTFNRSLPLYQNILFILIIDINVYFLIFVQWKQL